MVLGPLIGVNSSFVLSCILSLCLTKKMPGKSTSFGVPLSIPGEAALTDHADVYKAYSGRQKSVPY